MAMHEVQAGPGTIHWGYFDARLRPVVEIESGDTVAIDTISGDAGALPDDRDFIVRPALRAIHAEGSPDPGPHILTGPVAVKGAEPGDALRIEILSVTLADNWGFNLIRRGKGALPDDFPAGRLVYLPIDRARGKVLMPWGMEVEARPFFGVMGNAPAPQRGRLTSICPGSFGGNMDNRELVAGSVLYLPVAVAGGLFSVGDGHAAQGDGEVCLTAVETGLSGTFRIEVVKGANLEAPFATTRDHLIAMAFHQDLDEAVREAVRRMVAMVAGRTGISREEAYRLCSITGEMHVTQVVNGDKGIHMMMPRRLLETPFRPSTSR